MQKRVDWQIITNDIQANKRTINYNVQGERKELVNQHIPVHDEQEYVQAHRVLT